MGNPSPEILGLITCMVFVGGFIGAIFAAAPADRYGRRFAIQIGSFLGLFGSIMQAAAPSRGVLIGGRVIIGVVPVLHHDSRTQLADRAGPSSTAWKGIINGER